MALYIFDNTADLTIENFNVFTDVVKIEGLPPSAFTVLGGGASGSAVILQTAEGFTITLTGVTKAQIQLSNFAFDGGNGLQFGDGTTSTPPDAIGNVITLGNGGLGWGLEGNDTIDASNATVGVQANGNGGNDWISGGQGDDTLRGGADNDWVSGNSGDDLIFGDKGDDTLSGNSGNDTIWGGNKGEQASEADVIFGSEGSDLINGNGGDDYITGSTGKDTLRGGQGDDSIYGGEDADLIYGDKGSDEIYGGSGKDTIYGGNKGNQTAEDDTIYGGEDSDLIYGNAGDDVLSGSGGDDTLYGSAGDDTINGGSVNTTGKGFDVVFAGTGNDLVIQTQANVSQGIIDGGEGDDTIKFNAGSGAINTRIKGFEQGLIGGGSDEIDVTGVDIDKITATNATRAADIGMKYQPGTDDYYFNGSALTQADVELIGAAGNDTFIMGAGEDWASGGDGSDVLVGNGGADMLLGEDGNDTLKGGTGEDWLSGGDGDDSLAGGSGSDRLLGGSGNDTLSAGSDTSNESNTLSGGFGDDLIIAGSGVDRISINGWGTKNAPSVDTIKGFEAGVDKLYLDVSSGSSKASGSGVAIGTRTIRGVGPGGTVATDSGTLNPGAVLTGSFADLTALRAYIQDKSKFSPSATFDTAALLATTTGSDKLYAFVLTNKNQGSVITLGEIQRTITVASFTGGNVPDASDIVIV